LNNFLFISVSILLTLSSSINGLSSQHTFNIFYLSLIKKVSFDLRVESLDELYKVNLVDEKLRRSQ
jgi:hypothetical protein